MYKWRVKKSERGISLENFIYKQLSTWSHKQVKNSIDAKRAFINGKNVFISKWNLKPNDLVLFTPTKKDAETLGPQGRYKFIDVLFEDNYIIMTNKPPFIDFESYVETVKNYLKRKNQKEKSYPYLGQMHRLDKETSGIMAFTKKKVANTLAEQFRDHRIKKFYLALVNGQVQADQGTLNKKLEKGEFAEGKKSRVSDSPEAKRAITEYRVAERYEQATLLNVQILTGRTHQIRVHMSDLGHPIVGDKIYGGETGLPFNRQVLHAERLYFTHPITKKKMRLTAPLPADIQTLVDRLRDGEIVK